MPKKHEMQFGEGSFVGDYQRRGFDEVAARDQALALGWANGCPVALDLTDPRNSSVGRGPENMIVRYGEVNFWFTQIVREVAEVNPSLAQQLMEHVSRHDDERVGSFESSSVKVSYPIKMAPMNTLAGYALPRLFIENLHAAGDDREVVQQRMHDGLDVVTAAAREVEGPLALLATIAGEFSNRGLLPSAVILKNVLSTGWMGEHNAELMLDEFKHELEHRAPELYTEYKHLSDDEKRAKKLA